MSYQQLNVIASALIAVTTLSIFACLMHKGGQAYHKATCLFWGLLGLLLTINYFLMKIPNFLPSKGYICITIDVFGNAALLLAAYSLFKGTNFKWSNPVFATVGVSAVIGSLFSF